MADERTTGQGANFAAQLAREFSLGQAQAGNIIELIDGGNTIPFIARYRKEMTGGASDEVLRAFDERLAYLRNLEKRKDEVLRSIEEQGKLTEEIRAALHAAGQLSEVEDIYRPYKPKRRTRASIARERGLAPLAELMRAQQLKQGDPLEVAAPFVDPGKEVATAEDALLGAQDIIAEEIADDADIRKELKQFLWRTGIVRSQSKTEQETVYEMYYDFSEPVRRIADHRVLAINRGEKEEALKVTVEVDENELLERTAKYVLRGDSIFRSRLEDTVKDALSRLLYPSLERETRGVLTERATAQAIKMFGQNLKATLMQPPVKGKVILAIDPAYRTGCKTAVVDDTSKLLDYCVIYPTPPQNKVAEAKAKLKEMIATNGVTAVAVGNGTASKETEIFVSELLGELGGNIGYAMVNEAGASVYSASKLATQEFPELDVTIRGAISLARRLLDPISELVKIDPKSIGVGLYQHDMPPAEFDRSLHGVVEECVNAVGVNLNTASPSLLQYVAGVGPTLAKQIVAYREEIGRFESRRQLLKVPKLGPKAFTQCAGFLRVPDGKEPLDNTAVHPESYAAVGALLGRLGYQKDELKRGGLPDAGDRAQKYGLSRLADECGVGQSTLIDILAELQKPGRDMRDSLPPVELRRDLLSLEDLKEGMELSGVVRNVIDFGAFVDIGVHQDGLVHISQICDRYIRHPSEVLKPGDHVRVRVLGVDGKKKRISLTMKNL